MKNIANDLLAKKWFFGFFSSENNGSRLRIFDLPFLTIWRWLSTEQGVICTVGGPSKKKNRPPNRPPPHQLYTNLAPRCTNYIQIWPLAAPIIYKLVQKVPKVSKSENNCLISSKSDNFWHKISPLRPWNISQTIYSQKSDFLAFFCQKIMALA